MIDVEAGIHIEEGCVDIVAAEVRECTLKDGWGKTYYVSQPGLLELGAGGNFPFGGN